MGDFTPSNAVRHSTMLQRGLGMRLDTSVTKEVGIPDSSIQVHSARSRRSCLLVSRPSGMVPYGYADFQCAEGDDGSLRMSMGSDGLPTAIGSSDYAACLAEILRARMGGKVKTRGNVWVLDDSEQRSVAEAITRCYRDQGKAKFILVGSRNNEDLLVPVNPMALYENLEFALMPPRGKASGSRPLTESEYRQFANELSAATDGGIQGTWQHGIHRVPTGKVIGGAMLTEADVRRLGDLVTSHGNTLDLNMESRYSLFRKPGGYEVRNPGKVRRAVVGICGKLRPEVMSSRVASNKPLNATIGGEYLRRCLGI